MPFYNRWRGMRAVSAGTKGVIYRGADALLGGVVEGLSAPCLGC